MKTFAIILSLVMIFVSTFFMLLYFLDHNFPYFFFWLLILIWNFLNLKLANS